MSWSFEVFRFKGIPIRVHVSFVLILIWGAYYWSSVTDDGGRGALFGVAATLLLFLCVTLHELGHSLVARSYGIPVEDITLYPIGGVSRLADVPESPTQEFWITVAGPAVSFAIAAVLAIFAALIGEPAFVSPSHLVDDMKNPGGIALLEYLIFANLALGIFNILPAFPLDGGRILRSLLAMRMSYQRATRIAATIGQGMALLFGLIGFATLNVFLILIAVFIWLGAGAEGQQMSMRELLGTTKVGDAMTRQPWSLAPEFPLQRAVELILTTEQSDFPVVDHSSKVVGLVMMNDVLEALQKRPTATVGEISQPNYPRARPDERIVDVQERLDRGRGRALVVVDEQERLVGLLTRNDLLELIAVVSARPGQSLTQLLPASQTVPQAQH
jgi:Zn-dependent protease/predicted transcriptional regulator